MDWNLARINILDHMTVGSDINTKNSTYRKIVQVPPYKCNTYDYKGAEGFKVQIGYNTSIEIPIFMLKILYEEGHKNNQIYDANIFIKYFGDQYLYHGCHVHVVGQIFLKSNIAEQHGSRAYKLL
jgi:hypothetical protein